MANNFDPLVTVNGTPLPDPSTYDANTSTLVDSGRNVQGQMIGSVIRDDVAKVSMTWRFLTVQQWSDIGRLFKISAGGSFVNPVRFFDQTEGQYVTRNMYVNDRKAGAFLRDPETGDLRGWTDCSLNLIEV